MALLTGELILVFEGTTEEYESLEARKQIKAIKEEFDTIKDLIHKVLCYGASPHVENHVIDLLKEYPEYWKQKVTNGIVYCKWLGVAGFEYYLGTAPEGKCPVCGHKGKYHIHANKQSSCRICTAELGEKRR